MTFHVPHAHGHALQDDHEISEIRKFLRLCGLAPQSAK
jgi:hypothetical protein